MIDLNIGNLDSDKTLSEMRILASLTEGIDKAERFEQLVELAHKFRQLDLYLTQGGFPPGEWTR